MSTDKASPKTIELTWSSTLSAPPQKAFEETFAMARKASWRFPPGAKPKRLFFEECLCPQTSLPRVSRVKMSPRYSSITGSAHTAGCHR
jgi:hypothetical protein